MTANSVVDNLTSTTVPFPAADISPTGLSAPAFKELAPALQPATALRAAITAAYARDEREHVRELLEQARVDDATQQAIQATAEALRRTLEGSQVRAHQLQRDKRTLEQRLRALQQEQGRSANAQSRVTRVRVQLAAERAGTLRLVYQVRGPSWQSSYRATLVPPDMAAEDVQAAADAGLLPTIRVKAGNATQAQINAHVASGQGVLRVERVEG